MIGEVIDGLYCGSGGGGGGDDDGDGNDDVAVVAPLQSRGNA